MNPAEFETWRAAVTDFILHRYGASLPNSFLAAPNERRKIATFIGIVDAAWVAQALGGTPEPCVPFIQQISDRVGLNAAAVIAEFRDCFDKGLALKTTVNFKLAESYARHPDEQIVFHNIEKRARNDRQRRNNALRRYSERMATNIETLRHILDEDHGLEKRRDSQDKEALQFDIPPSAAGLVNAANNESTGNHNSHISNPLYPAGFILNSNASQEKLAHGNMPFLSFPAKDPLPTTSCPINGPLPMANCPVNGPLPTSSYQTGVLPTMSFPANGVLPQTIFGAINPSPTSRSAPDSQSYKAINPSMIQLSNNEYSVGQLATSSRLDHQMKIGLSRGLLGSNSGTTGKRGPTEEPAHAPPDAEKRSRNSRRKRIRRRRTVEGTNTGMVKLM